MSEGTSIEWTHRPGTRPATMNALVGCQKVSQGCRHCYAIEVAHIRAGNPLRVLQDKFAGTTRVEGDKRVWTGKVTLTHKALFDPLKRVKPRTYFVNSLSDLFYEEVPVDWVDQHFAIFALCPQHTFIILTKRPERMKAYLQNPDGLRQVNRKCTHILQAQYCGIPSNWPLPNVWLGTSVEDQETADDRIPHLLETPAAIRFISAEPLIGPLDIWAFLRGKIRDESLKALGSALLPGLDWAICGGESGKGARPMHPDWPRYLKDQCATAGVPYFFKQWGEWLPLSDYDPFVHGMKADKYAHQFAWHAGVKNDAELPISCYRVGKKAAGHLLDDVVYQNFPEAR